MRGNPRGNLFDDFLGSLPPFLGSPRRKVYLVRRAIASVRANGSEVSGQLPAEMIPNKCARHPWEIPCNRYRPVRAGMTVAKHISAGRAGSYTYRVPLGTAEGESSKFRCFNRPYGTNGFICCFSQNVSAGMRGSYTYRAPLGTAESESLRFRCFNRPYGTNGFVCCFSQHSRAGLLSSRP